MTCSKITEIRPNLYLTGHMWLNEQKLKKHRITHAVDATNLSKALKVSGIEYFYVKVDDKEDENLGIYFESATDFIKSAIDGDGRVIVYCAAGISRSSSIIIMYLLIHENFSLKDAYYEVVSKRHIISPNNGFWRQMIEYEKGKNGESTVKFLEDNRMEIPDVYLNKLKAIKERDKAYNNHNIYN